MQSLGFFPEGRTARGSARGEDKRCPPLVVGLGAPDQVARQEVKLRQTMQRRDQDNLDHPTFAPLFGGALAGAFMLRSPALAKPQDIPCSPPETHSIEGKTFSRVSRRGNLVLLRMFFFVLYVLCLKYTNENKWLHGSFRTYCLG